MNESVRTAKNERNRRDKMALNVSVHYLFLVKMVSDKNWFIVILMKCEKFVVTSTAGYF